MDPLRLGWDKRIYSAQQKLQEYVIDILAFGNTSYANILVKTEFRALCNLPTLTGNAMFVFSY